MDVMDASTKLTASGQNYGAGCPEIVVNSLKRKASHEQTLPKNVKAKKG